MWAPLPANVLAIVLELHELALEPLLVGGATRDILLGRVPRDFDLCVPCSIGVLRTLYPDAKHRGGRHPMVKIKHGKLDVEILPRKGRDLLADARARDLTVNAIYLDPVSGVIFDPFGGVHDLDTGVARVIGDPAARFAEDPIRVLRLARIAGALDLKVSRATLEAARKTVYEASDHHIGLERKRFNKLQGPARARVQALHRLLGVRFPSRDRKRAARVERRELARWIDPNPNSLKLRFGRFKGRYLGEIPTSYLRWIARTPTFPGTLHRLVGKELGQRRANAKKLRERK